MSADGEKSSGSELTHYYANIDSRLEPFISSIWATRSDIGFSNKLRIMQDGSCTLIFNFSGPIQMRTEQGMKLLSNTFFAGVNSGYVDLIHSGKHEQVGIIFKPGAAFQLINIPIFEFQNAAIEADLISQDKFRGVFNRMSEIKSLKRRIVILQDWLLLLLANQSISTAIHQLTVMLQRSENITTLKLAGIGGFSQQHTARLFKKYVGAAPKVMQRIFRFQKALKSLQSRSSLTATGYDCEYYDQAHFIHDFKSLSGLTPGELSYHLIPSENRVIIF